MDEAMAKVETVRKGMLGKVELCLARKDERFFGFIDGVVTLEGDVADEVWRRLHDEAGKTNPQFFGFDGARARFLRYSPDGFYSQRYLGDERNYKLAAKSKARQDSAPGRRGVRVRFWRSRARGLSRDKFAVTLRENPPSGRAAAPVRILLFVLRRDLRWET